MNSTPFPVPFHKAFSLVELLVVIGILGVLIAVLLGGFSGSTESARATKCLSNLRNLSLAWSGDNAGSQEMLNTEVRKSGVTLKYSENQGWISWATQGLYPAEESQKEKIKPIGFFETDRDIVEYAIMNGWMAAAIGKDRGALVCPSHLKMYEGKIRPNWSYFMNARFGWLEGGGKTKKSELPGPDRVLLFAEIPFQGVGTWFPGGSAGSTETDAILQYDGCTGGTTPENIGGNHKSGKHWFAHVAFADGHVEKLRVDGLSDENLKDLTTWLCEGKSIGRNGNKYEELK